MIDLKRASLSRFYLDQEVKKIQSYYVLFIKYLSMLWLEITKAWIEFWSGDEEGVHTTYKIKNTLRHHKKCTKGKT